HSQLADANIDILNAPTVAAHIQRIEVIDVNMLATVVSFAGPEFGVRLALQDVTNLNKGFAQTELIVTNAIGEARIARRIRGVGLDHALRLRPRLIGSFIWIDPIVDKNEFSVGLCFVPEAVFRARSGRLKGNLFPTLAVQAVPGAKVSMEFKGVNVFLQL